MENKEILNILEKNYKEYKQKHIEHHNTCPLCKWPTRISNLYWQDWYLECIACKNSKWEGYFFKPWKYMNKEEWIMSNGHLLIWKQYTYISTFVEKIDKKLIKDFCNIFML